MYLLISRVKRCFSLKEALWRFDMAPREKAGIYCGFVKIKKIQVKDMEGSSGRRKNQKL